jgi:hypothetical protein
MLELLQIPSRLIRSFVLPKYPLGVSS